MAEKAKRINNPGAWTSSDFKNQTMMRNRKRNQKRRSGVILTQENHGRGGS